MIAIECKYIPATNYRPSRIVASANRNRLVMSVSTAETATGDTGDDMAVNRYVAQALADKMSWGPLGDGGGTKSGYVFCFREKVQA